MQLKDEHVWCVARGCAGGREGCSVVCSGPLGVAQGQGEWLTTKIQQNKRRRRGARRGRRAAAAAYSQHSDAARTGRASCRRDRRTIKSMHDPQPAFYVKSYSVILMVTLHDRSHGPLRHSWLWCITSVYRTRPHIRNFALIVFLSKSSFEITGLGASVF